MNDDSFYFLILKGEGSELFSGVIDGGDIASVKFTGLKLGLPLLKDKTCICHLLNNLIKNIIQDYFEEAYLQVFFQQQCIYFNNQSNSFHSF